MKTAAPTASLDRRGTTITTLGVFDAATALRDMHLGETLELVTDDFEPFRHDVAAWCDSAGHRLLACEATNQGLRFLIERGPTPTPTGTLAIVVSTDGLEELLSPLGFALAAALEGTAVHLYFQGPAVRVLRRGFRPKLHGWSRPFTRFAGTGLAKAGHLPAQQKLRQLRSLGAQVYVCGPSMQHFKVDRAQLIFDDLPIIEYLTFMQIMKAADIQLYP